MSHLGPGSKLASSKEQAGLRYPSNGKTIYHRPLNRSKTAELSQAAFAYLFSEMVSYAQKRSTGIQELEKRCVSLLTFSLLLSNHLPYLDLTNKATQSASNCWTYSSSANPHAPRTAP